MDTAKAVTAAPDTTPPETSLDSYPSDPSASASASFSFSSSEAGSTFECQAGRRGVRGLHQPQGYTGLSDGSHTFQVRATDAASNTDPTPASYTWTVDTSCAEDDHHQPGHRPGESQTILGQHVGRHADEEQYHRFDPVSAAGALRLHQPERHRWRRKPHLGLLPGDRCGEQRGCHAGDVCLDDRPSTAPVLTIARIHGGWHSHGGRWWRWVYPADHQCGYDQPLRFSSRRVRLPPSP